MNKKIIADMHTHSENSHDCMCTIEEMCLSQIKKGTAVMAVTDHFDTASFNDYDIHTPIKTACEKTKLLGEKYKDKCMLLCGVEISEGFWYPEEYKKIINAFDYDVVIGSVHLVKYKELTMAYSGIDFGKLSEVEIYSYLNSYFDDIIAMLNTTDFDILAHLTCPLRYITGKYNIKINQDVFKEKTDIILQEIIKREIALEVNTSSYDVMGKFMPSKDITERFYEMGGRLLTLGSDAHVSENASRYFGEAVDMIKSIGFKKLYYFVNRKPVEYEI